MADATIRIRLPEEGLNLTAQVFTDAGSYATDRPVTESSPGLYVLTFTAASGKYSIRLTDDDDSDSTLGWAFVRVTSASAATYSAAEDRALLDIAEDAEDAAAGGGGGGGGGEVSGFSAAAISQLGGTTIRLASNEQTDNRHLEIVRGCDYSSADGTALTWTITDAQDLADSEATLTFKKGTTTQAFTGTVTESAADTWQITIELTAAETSALTASPTDWTYSLTITLPNGHVRSIRKPGHFARILSPS